MIEAVNSSILNSAALRGSAEQISAVQRVELEAPEPSEVSVQLAPFVSPYIQVDNRFDTAVIQIRDSDTGDVLTQFPSEPALRTRESVEAFLSASETPVDIEPINNTVSSSESTPEASVETVTIAQSAPPAQAQGAGVAQAAIAALSTGAQSGQGTPTANVQVNA